MRNSINQCKTLVKSSIGRVDHGESRVHFTNPPTYLDWLLAIVFKLCSPLGNWNIFRTKVLKGTLPLDIPLLEENFLNILSF